MDIKLFTDFNYQVIESPKEGYALVQVLYKYKDKPLTNFVYIKEGKGVNYINEAKAIIENDLKKGKLPKHAPRSHKGLLATVIAVTAGAAIACGGLLTYKYLNEGPGQQEVSVVDMIIEDIKALNENSTEAEILKARTEYDNLSGADKAKVPAEVVTKLKEQEEKFNNDKTSASNFKDYVYEKLPNPETCTSANLKLVEKAESDLNKRTKTLVTDETYAYIATAANNFNEDKIALDSIIEIVRKLDDTSSLADFEQHKVTVTTFETQHGDLIELANDIKGEFNAKYNDCMADYDYIRNEDTGFVKVVNNLDAIKTTATWDDDIKPVLENRDFAVSIGRRRDSVLQGEIIRANNKLMSIVSAYDSDKVLLTQLEGYVNKLIPDRCNKNDIEYADNLITNIKSNVQRSDILASVTSIENGALKSCKDSYNGDEQRLQNLLESIKNINADTCTQSNIDDARENIQNAYKYPQKRGGDENLQDILEQAKQAIDDVAEVYERDLDEINTFHDLAYQLDDTTEYQSSDPEEVTFEMVNDKAEEIDEILEKRQNDMKLWTIVNDAKRKIKYEEDKFDDEQNSLENYKNAVDRLSDDSSIEEIWEVEELREAVFISKRPTFIADLANADAYLAQIKGTYTEQERLVGELLDKVDAFHEDTCRLSELSELSDRWGYLDYNVSYNRENFRTIIDECGTTIQEFSESYWEDFDAAYAFNSAVDELSEASSDTDIAAVETLVERAKDAARHPDLAEDGISDHLATLESLRAAHSTNKEKVRLLKESVDNTNEATCSFDEVNTLRAEVGALLEDVTQSDLIAELNVISTDTTALLEKIMADDSIGQEFIATVGQISKDTPIESSEYEKAEEKLPDAQRVAQHTGEEFDQLRTAITNYITIRDKRFTDEGRVESFDALVNNLEAHKDICSNADITACENAKSALSDVEATDLLAKINTDATKINTIRAQYQTDSSNAATFMAQVDVLETKAAPTDDEIKAVENLLPNARKAAKHTDLSANIESRITKLENIRALYEQDKGGVDAFIQMVEKLEKAMYTCSDADIKECENAATVLASITRTDLKAKVDEYTAKIAPIRAKYNEDKTNAQAFNEAVKGVSQNPFPADEDIRGLELQVADMKIIALHTDLKSGIDTDIQKVEDMRSKYSLDEANAKAVVGLIDALYEKTGASVIALDDINAVATAYNALTNDRAKGIADDLCKIKYGLDVISEVTNLIGKHNIGKAFETAYNISSLPSDPTEYDTNAEKYHFLSIVHDYDSLDTISKHSLDEENQQKLIDIPASLDIEYACDTLINTGDEGLESISHTFDSTYGYMAKASIKNDIDPSDIHVSALKFGATEVANLKQNYSKVHFVIRVSNVILGADEQINVQFDESESGTASFQRVFITEDNVGQYIDVTLNVGAQDFPDTLVVILEKAKGDKFAGLTFEISSFYGEPIA